jgi:hypothetical protein
MVRSLRGRHAALALIVVVLAGLAFGGCLGPAVGSERITAYDVVAVIREDRTVAVREVIDWDFGGDQRHGIFRTIPASGGTPTDIEVSSPGAPDAFTVNSLGGETEIRIGDEGREVSGRHRYVISYVLPETVQGDRFALNAIGDRWPVPSEDVTVTVLGAELARTECFTGPYGSDDRCAIEATGTAYRTQVEDLGDHEAVTVAGDVVATGPAEVPEPPPFADRDDSARLRWAAIVAVLGAVVALAVYLACRWIGRNEVAAGGPTEAAFADGADGFGPQHAVPTDPPPTGPGTTMVADTEMGELAGVEFVPPRGIEPWQGAVVLRETIDDRTVGAFFSGLAAHDIVTIDGTDGGVLRAGPRAAEADAVAAPILNRAFGTGSAVPLGTYDADFAAAWQEAGRAIDAWVLSSGVFRRRPPRYGSSGRTGGLGPLTGCLVPAAFLVLAGGSSLAVGLRTGFAAVAVAVIVVGAAALALYSVLTRGLSARGSAIALRAESFRRFLHHSEAQHVEWAWQHGLLREYAAWAVALGEADAFHRALSASSVPPVEVSSTNGVLMPALYLTSFSSTTTAPPPASSGGGGFSGGGFSGGGFSGGGGGGGGGGSW